VGLARKRAPLEASGPARGFLLEDDEAETGYLPEDWVFGNTSFIEQVFTMAGHGSCTGYAERDGRVVPQLREHRAQDAYRRMLHATVEDFAGSARELLEHDLDAV